MHANHQAIIDTLSEDPTLLIAWVARELVALGAKTAWDLDDNMHCTEGLCSTAVRYGLPDAGNYREDSHEFYGKAAIALGYDTDYEEDDNEH